MSKNLMWAPWRVKYITKTESDNCIFCEKAAKSNDKKNYILYRGKTAFAMLNIYPYNNGHIMIAPYSHIADLNNLSKDEICETMNLVKKFVARIKDKMNAQGFNIGMNLGKVAGAGIDSHIHIHIVPRWLGDTNFMPVISDEKVISESLDSVYEKLRV